MSSLDFLDKKNDCGQTILKLVSRGNAILAELLRLSDFIPPVFRMATKEERDAYHFILPDFSYFAKQDYYDMAVNTNPDVEERDEVFKDAHMEIVTRFYKMFESIYKYIMDLNRFLSDLEEGVFVQQTLEIVLFNEDGKQLLSESVFLYGAMLLILDMRVEGTVRERMIVAFHRHSGGPHSSMDTNIEDVCKLLRSTGYQHLPSVKRPPNYPESFLSRLPVSDTFIRMVIGRLRSDDIYNQITSYPNPEHRSTALATQAAMLYVILYFAPDILHSHQAQMREIVDKHFPDNWILSLYMGITVNLIDVWEPYKAAKTALNNTLEQSNVETLSARHAAKAVDHIGTVLSLLKEGTLAEDYVLDHVPRLMKIVRDCNVTIRWLILHAAPIADYHKRAKQVREAVLVPFNGENVFKLLINTAQLEFLLKEMFKKLMSEKQDKWAAYQKEGMERMVELADVFSGTKPLTRVEKNEHLQAWFRDMSTEIGKLSYEDFTVAGRKITQLKQALEEVLEFHGLENNMQVKQFLADTRQYLHQMLRTVNIREEVLITLQQIADLSYAWLLIDSYTPHMQQGIQRDPRLVIKLRSTFLKLASGMELPLTRISEAKSDDLTSVSAYYSRQLVAYVRKVLQIIPRTMFELLGQIIEILTHQMKEVPMKLEKDKMKEAAQLDLRRRVSELTHKISIFTEGMLLMKTTLVGVVKVDPKKLLEDGIRKELVAQVSRTLHEGLTFNPRARPPELEPKLRMLASKMSGFRRSFEYIQDYVSIYGLKIWQEEVSRIINYNVEQECNSFLLTRIEDWQSVYQSKNIPIPKFHPLGDGSVTFIGRLAREVQRMTDPKVTVYVDATNAWYDARTNMEVVNLKLWAQLQEAVDIFGLTALDRLFCFMIVRELQHCMKLLKRSFGKPEEDTQLKKLIQAISRELAAPPILIANAPRVYSSFMTQMSALFEPILRCVMVVGQMQLIRRQVCRELGSSSKYDSKLLYNTLQAFNQALLRDMRTHYRDPTQPYPGGEEGELLYDITPYLESVGISDPITKIYVTTPANCSHGISMVMFLFVASHLSRLVYSKKVGTLLRRKVSEPLDGAPFVVGTLTFLRQFHSDNTHECLALLGQYIRSMLECGVAASKDKLVDFPNEVVNALFFLEEFAHYGHMPRRSLEQYAPTYLLDQFRHYIQ